MGNNKIGQAQLSLILGQAGSGKSFTVENNVKSGKYKKPIILADSHALIKKIEDRFGDFDIKVITIQSIVNKVEQNDRNNILDGYETVIFDEFSKIKYDYLTSVIDTGDKVGITNYIAAGDFLQNAPIGSELVPPLLSIVKENLKGLTPYFMFTICRDENVYKLLKDINEVKIPDNLKQWISKIDMEILLDNHRQSGMVVRNFTDVNNIIEKNRVEISKGAYSLLEFAKHEDWQVVVADWEQLDKIDNMIKGRLDDSEIKSPYYRDSRHGVANITQKDKYKQFAKIVEIIDENGEKKNVYQYLNNTFVEYNDLKFMIKTNAIICHSIQGLEYKNVLLYSYLEKSVSKNGENKITSWSNFDFRMIYTAMTRHKENVFIFADKKGIEDFKNCARKLPKYRKRDIELDWLSYCKRFNVKYEDYCTKLFKLKSDSDEKYFWLKFTFYNNEKGETSFNNRKYTAVVNFAGNVKNVELSYISRGFYYKNILRITNNKLIKNSSKIVIDFIMNHGGVNSFDMKLSIRKFNIKYGKKKSTIEKGISFINETGKK